MATDMKHLVDVDDDDGDVDDEDDDDDDELPGCGRPAQQH